MYKIPNLLTIAEAVNTLSAFKYDLNTKNIKVQILWILYKVIWSLFTMQLCQTPAKQLFPFVKQQKNSFLKHPYTNFCQTISDKR